MAPAAPMARSPAMIAVPVRYFNIGVPPLLTFTVLSIRWSALSCVPPF
jgi:hypothetical protein